MVQIWGVLDLDGDISRKGEREDRKITTSKVHKKIDLVGGRKISTYRSRPFLRYLYETERLSPS